MAASERARELVTAYGKAEYFLAETPLMSARLTEAAHRVKHTADALLAYVARLEAVAATAREACEDFHLVFAGQYRGVVSRLDKALAALDRPEDGE